MPGRVVSFACTFDDTLVIVDARGEIWEERRQGARRTWHRIDLTGLSPKAPKAVALRADSTIVCMTSDNTLFVRQRVSGSRDNAVYRWDRVDTSDPP